jgi:hypothetical protein
MGNYQGQFAVTPITRKQLKQVLGELPLTAEVFWQLRQPGRPLTKSFSLHRLEKVLPEWCAQASRSRQQIGLPEGKQRKVLLFGTLRQWIQQASLLGLTLAGLGHNPLLVYLPYSDWRHSYNRFDLRRQNLYTKKILQAAQPLLQTESLLTLDRINPKLNGNGKIPQALSEAVEQVSIRDVQYTLQVEEFDRQAGTGEASELYRLRMERNLQASRALMAVLQSKRPDVVIIPNGSILEMGVAYQVARHLGYPVVTYEFGEQRQRIWLAQDAEVMHQDTSALWKARRAESLSGQQLEKIKNLYASRQEASLWENFSRRWQGLPSQGARRVRAELNLDDRPVALLAANVIGDSLTLGRQTFTKSMTEWLERTVDYFVAHPETQLVVRIHPGERYTKGQSVADIIRQHNPKLPKHIVLVPANAAINTYDLVEIARLGLVYTTTLGMEMAMSGVPVVVVGKTHYREKGFTIDPTSWEAYFSELDRLIDVPGDDRLSRQQVERAWRYAYRFFFEYPCPFPWHLHFFALDEIKRWPLQRVLAPEGQGLFGDTFRYLLGEPRDWKKAKDL